MIFDNNQYITEPKTDESTRPVGAAVVPSDPKIDPKTGLPPRRAFYVEESYAISWMYPYLTPHGLIMKLNNEPTPITPEMIKNDTDFWNWYCKRLLNDERFLRDVVARKTFSKLRTSIAGLYAARGFYPEAEYAFKQARKLYPLSPEAVFRLATLYLNLDRIDDAEKLMKEFKNLDPLNDRTDQYINYIQKVRKCRDMERKLFAAGKEPSFTQKMELVKLYLESGNDRRAIALLARIVHDPRTTADQLIATADALSRLHNYPLVIQALQKYTAKRPNDLNGLINLAAFQLAVNRPAQALQNLEKAVKIGGDKARERIRRDDRFAPLRNYPAFRRLVPPPQPGEALLPGLPGI